MSEYLSEEEEKSIDLAMKMFLVGYWIKNGPVFDEDKLMHEMAIVFKDKIFKIKNHKKDKLVNELKILINLKKI